MTWNDPFSTRIQAIVFDKDGVLADTETINVRSAFEVFGAHGHPLRPEDEAEIVGKHPIDYVPLFANRFGLSEAQRRRIIEEQETIYSRTWQEKGRLIDGSREALDAARSTGLGVGLATSSGRDEVDAFIKRFRLGSYFDVTLSFDDVARAKPDPEIYLKAARALDARPDEMLIIEDSEHGVRAAKEAGAVCVAVRNPYVLPERVSMADVRIDSLTELPALLVTLRAALSGGIESD